MRKIFTSIFVIGVLIILFVAYFHARSNMMILPFTSPGEIMANIDWLTTVGRIIFLTVILVFIYRYQR